MTIASILESNRNKRIKVVCVGDTMRDEYHVGTVSRTAQEAPVPVLRTGWPVSEWPFAVPGGAGNVARQLKHWNADVRLVALVDDETAELLGKHQIADSGLVNTLGGINPLKRRFVSRGQLLFRQDIESVDYGVQPRIAKLRRNIVESFEAAIEDGANAVILSDYAKGLFDSQTLRAIITACQERGIPTIADPHCSRHPHDYSGVTAFKPNEEYVRERGGKCFEFPGNLYWFKKTLSPTECMAYTRGGEPPCGFVGGREDAEDFVCRERFDPIDAVNVVGAGDCFTAHLALGMAHGLDFKDACELAYSAGRDYVTMPYNEPPWPHDVLNDIDPVAAKMATAEEIRCYFDRENEDTRLVFTNGTFRLGAHAGQIATLQHARRQGDILIVGINDDFSVARLKPGQFCLPLEQRMAMLAALECVDFVVPFAEDTPERIMEVIRPDVLVKGPDNAGRTDIPGADIVKEVKIAPKTGLPHASDIAEAIAQHSRRIGALA